MQNSSMPRMPHLQLNLFPLPKSWPHGKICRSKPFHRHVPQAPVPESSQLSLQSTSPVSNIPNGIRTITCANTENWLSLPHIKHVTTEDAAPTIHIHINSDHVILSYLTPVLIYQQQVESYWRAWVNMWTTFYHLALCHKQLMMQQWANCQWCSIWVTGKSRITFTSPLEYQEPWCLGGLPRVLAFSQSITLICICHGHFVTFY